MIFEIQKRYWRGVDKGICTLDAEVRAGSGSTSEEGFCKASCNFSII